MDDGDRGRGETDPAREAASTGPAATTRISAYGLARQGRRILLCRLSDRLPAGTGRWTLPGGGLEFGEDPAAAMVREVREETGLVVRPAGLAGIDSRVLGFDDRTMHAIRVLYFADVIGGELASETDGSTDLCAWHETDDVGSLPVVELVDVGLALVRARGARR